VSPLRSTLEDVFVDLVRDSVIPSRGDGEESASQSGDPSRSAALGMTQE